MSQVDREARQALYDLIRGTSKDEVILKEMIRLGFWPDGGNLPGDPASDIARTAAIQTELSSLRSESTRLHNVEALKKAARKERFAESRRNQVETKARRERERLERAQAYRDFKSAHMVYVGEGYSHDMYNHDGNSAALSRWDLPDVQSGAAIASSMGIELGELRWLAYSREVSTQTHYRQFQIPKKTGGMRLISAPMPRLKAAQRWVLEQILERVPVHTAAHGFVRGRSIVTNATPHVGKAIVVNMDLKNFFPTVSYPRVRGFFLALGYSRESAAVLALLCTEAETTAIDLDGTTHYVQTSERHLPQGSPASPAITNGLCFRLDKRLMGIAKKHGFTYTRYADDLTFSTTDRDAKVAKLLGSVRRIVTDEAFVIHPDKTRVMRQGRRQEVTGLVVNSKAGVPKDMLKRFRAVLFQIERDGPADKQWGHTGDLFAALTGFASFVNMVDPITGRRLLDRVGALAMANGYQRNHRARASVNQVPSWEAKKQQAAAQRVADQAVQLADAKSDEAAAKAGLPPKRGGAASMDAGRVVDATADPNKRDTVDPNAQEGIADYLFAGEKKWWQVWRD